MPEPDDEPDPLLAPHGYGTASLDGGRTLEDIRRERRARSTRVTHRCQWCHSAIVEPLQAEVHDDLGQFGLLVLEASDGPWAWCDRCAMYLDNTGWLAATPMDDANRKRYRRRQRNLWLVERGGLQAVTHG